MSIIKRKAGSEDIVKSVLEFDDVPTEGSPNMVESGAVAQAIGNLGNPLQWKGPATVAQLNTGITGIQPGWTYTLTDAGTLTDGSVKVDVGDEVAWTEDDEWFKLGGEAANVKVLTYTEASKPLLSDLQNARDNGKAVFLVCGEDVHAGSYWLEKGTVLSLVFDTGRPGYRTQSMEFMCTGAFKGGDCVTVRCVVNGNNTWEWHAYIHPKSSAIAPEYDSTATYAVGDAVMHNGLRYECNTAISTAEAWDSTHWTETSVEDVIGNVASLLAAL